ncbi:hypothetical protein BS47DRAFT_81569 [Hydnum rufescens UP504]|uniref:Proteophosphoglycan ppg4 n=1 Tax=Hydnum rufescens UP504 TaxID=1448309 RepID=A0A9P6B8J9_9AGAM|nr:hypothetical protein BS47DRAFT_81569 [Hydnum rufescens UP504]
MRNWEWWCQHDSQRAPTTHPAKKVESTLAGSWFIGVFGKWWLGGRLQVRPHNDSGHAGPQTINKEERFSAGVLSVRAVDYDPVAGGSKNITESFSALASKSQSRKAPTNGGRNGDKRSSRRSIANGHSINIITPVSPSPRTSSPPPLPKSVSLPLHTARVVPASDNNRIAKGVSGSSVSHSRSFSPSSTPSADGSLYPTAPSLHSVSTNKAISNIPLTSATTLANASHSVPPSLLDQSPIIVDILKQLDVSRGEVAEARSQFATFEQVSAAARATLQSTLDEHRERKREEEALRIDLKLRNKILEESKRQAEATKREAEKKLKTVQAARDRAVNRIESLGKDIDELWKHTQEDRERIVQSKSHAVQAETDLITAVDEKRQEIKVAEDVVAALMLRAKELEAQIQDEMKALERVQEVATKKLNHPSHPIFADHYRASSFPLASISPASNPVDISAPSSAVPLYQRLQNTHAAESLVPQTDSDGSSRLSKHNLLPPSSGPSLGLDVHEQPHSPVGLSRFASSSGAFGSGMQHRHFSPFADGAISPLAASLIPSSLFSSIEADVGLLPTSPHNDESIYSKQQRTGDADHANQNQPWQQPPLTEVQTRQAYDDAPEVLYTSPVTSNFFPTSPILTSAAASIDFHSPSTVGSDGKESGTVGKASKRWFTSSSHSSAPPATTKANESSSRLNPDAKVFSFTRGRSFLFPNHNGNGTRGSSAGSADYGSKRDRHTSPGSFTLSPPSPPRSASSTTSFLSSLLAFTPSPAEREALQRALGQNYANANGSGDRLALPEHHTSPNPSHVQPQPLAHRNSLPLPPSGASPFTSPLPSARSSNLDLSQVPPHAGLGPGPGWADLYLSPSSASMSTSSLPSDPSAVGSGAGGVKRSFSSLWNRKKGGTASTTSAAPTLTVPTSGVSAVSEEEV